MRRRRGPHRAALASLVSILSAQQAAAANRAPQEVLEQIVVTVNGDVITKREIDERMRVTRSLSEDQSADAEPEFLTRVLQDAVDERLMMQRATELGIDVREEDVDRVIASVKEESHVQSDEAFLALLEREGMALSTLRATTRRRLVIEQVRQRLFARVSVTNEEAMRYFTANRRALSPRVMVTFRELRIAVPAYGRVANRERDRALVKVVHARDQLASGVDFVAVAERFSESTSPAGGELVGPTDLESLDTCVRAALRSLEPGAVSAPLETPDGYGFWKLESVERAGGITFHENRERIMRTLLEDKQRVALEDLLGRLRGSAILQWKRRDLQLAYERPPAYR